MLAARQQRHEAALEQFQSCAQQLWKHLTDSVRSSSDDTAAALQRSKAALDSRLASLDSSKVMLLDEPSLFAVRCHACLLNHACIGQLR